MKVVSLSFRQILVKFLYTVPSKLGVRTNFLKIQSWKLLIQIALHLYFSDFVRDWHSQEASYLFQDVGKKKQMENRLYKNQNWLQQYLKSR